MNNNFQINFTLNPSFDINKFNVIISHLKKSLGEFGKDIKLIDTNAINADFEKLAKESKTSGNQVKETLQSVGVAADNTAKSAGLLQKAFAFNQIMQSVQFISQSISQLTQAGVEFEAGLAAVGAITGFTGEKLDVLGESARSLSVKFGGSANDQLKSFQGILSKLGPAIAEDAGALELFANNVNILSAASGDDAATSMQAITDAMLQLGLATGTPMEQAQNSTRVINALAASAQVGAAEIPQVAAALVQVGSTAKTFGMDVESVNASLQVLAVGGKTGAEAGVALRNVMLLMASASGPAEQTMKKLGTSSKELGETLANKGIDQALAKLKVGLDKLSAAEKAVSLKEIFGAENVAAGSILVDNLDKYGEFLDGIKAGEQGTGSAFEQAQMRMDTAESMIARSKAFVENIFIGLSQSAGHMFTTIVGASAQIAPMVMTFAGLGQVIPFGAMKQFGLTLLGQVVPSLVVTDAATNKLIFSKEALSLSTLKARAIELSVLATSKISNAVKLSEIAITSQLATAKTYLSGATLKSVAADIWHGTVLIAKTAAVKIVTAAQWLWNAAMSANPIGAIILGIGAFIAISKVLSDVLHTTAKERVDELKSEDQLLDKQIQNIQAQKQKVQSNQGLLKSYEELGQKVNRTAEEEAKYKQVQLDISKAYPGLIKEGKSFEQNLESIKNKASEGKNEISNWNKELSKLESKKIELAVELKKGEVGVAKENIEDTITDATSGFDWNKVWVGALSTGNIGGAVAAGFGDQITEFLFGTSGARKAAEDGIKKYTDAIYQASNEADLSKATQNFKMAILNDKNFEGLDPKVKEKLLSQIDDMGKAQTESIKASQDRAADLLKTAMNDALNKGIGVAPETVRKIAQQTGRPISELNEELVNAFVSSADASQVTESSIQNLAKSIGKTTDETKEMLLSKTLEEAAKKGKLTGDQVQVLADKFGISKDRALELYKIQEKQTAEAKKTADAAKGIGERYAENIKKLNENMTANSLKYNALKDKQLREGLTTAEQLEMQQLEQWLTFDSKALQNADKIDKQSKAKFKTTWEEKKNTVKDISDKILQIQQENRNLEQQIANSKIKDEDLKAKKEKEINLKTAEDKLNVEIKALEEKKKRNAQEVQQLELLRKQLTLTQEKNANELFDFEVKLAQKQLDEKKKLQDQEIANQKEANKLQLELMEQNAGAGLNTDQLIASLEEQHRLRLDIIKTDSEEQIKQIIENNVNYQKAEESRLLISAQILAKENQLKALRTSGASDEIIKTAENELTAFKAQLKATEDDIEKIENTISGSDVVKTIKLKVKISEDAENRKTSDAIREANLRAITNTAVRERELKIFEAEKTYKADLEMAQGNEALKYEAFIKYQQAKFDAEQQYLRKSSKLVDVVNVAFQDAMASFGQSLIDSSIKPVEEAIAKLEDQLDKLRNPDNSKELDRIKNEEKALLESLKKREITSQDYYKKLNELEKEREKLLGESASRSEILLARLQLGLAKGFQSMQDHFNVKADEASGRLATKVSANVDRLKKEGKEGSASLGDIFKGTSEDLQDFAMSAVGSSVASFATMLAAGEEFGKAFRLGLLKNLLDLAQKAILTYIPQIYAAFISWMGPWGIAAATGAIALVYAGLEMAKSAIGAWRGVVDIQGPGTETSDSIPARLSKGESVLNAEGTRAGDNKELFRWVNKTKKPAIEFFITEKPQLMKSLVSDAIKSEVSLIKAQKDALATFMVMNDTRSDRELIRKIEEQNMEIRDMKKLIAEGNYKRKTINQVDVEIDVSDKEIIRRIDINKKARLRRM